jgi:hypothetical protein
VCGHVVLSGGHGCHGDPLSWMSWHPAVDGRLDVAGDDDHAGHAVLVGDHVRVAGLAELIGYLVGLPYGHHGLSDNFSK